MATCKLTDWYCHWKSAMSWQQKSLLRMTNMVHILPDKKERMGLELMSSLTEFLATRIGKKQSM